MSENIPESIPTSADRRSHRPVKKTRLTAYSQQSAAVEKLMDNFEDKAEIQIPKSATKGPKTTADLAPPPEIVTNVQGSSAGAGSGEFHVYKASRRREYERLRLMEDEAKREDERQSWEEKQRLNKEKDEARTNKNRKRREKLKANKQKVKQGVDKDTNESAEQGKVGKLKPLEIKRPEERPEDEADMQDIEGAGPNEENGIVMLDDD